MTEREYIIQRDPPRPDWDEQACRNLASAILQQAVSDLRDPFERKKAEAWIFQDSEACELWCEIAGVDLEAFRDRARKILVH